MPRLREIPRREATNPFVEYIYGVKFGDRDFETAPGIATGAPGNFETVLAQVPDVLEHVVRGFNLWYSPDRKLDPFLKEIALLRVGWTCQCRFIYSQHCKVMRGMGASEQQIEAISSWQTSDLFDGRQKAVLAYADALALEHGRIADRAFAELKSHLSEIEIIELAYVTSMYVMFAGIAKSMRLEFDDRDDVISEVPAPDGYTWQSRVGRIQLPE